MKIYNTVIANSVLLWPLQNPVW